MDILQEHERPSREEKSLKKHLEKKVPKQEVPVTQGKDRGPNAEAFAGLLVDDLLVLDPS